MIPALAERAFALMTKVPIEGAIVEFGVYQGGSLASFVSLARRHLRDVPPVFGFDTFSGIPSSQVELSHALADFWAEGEFANTSVDRVRSRLNKLGVEPTLVPAIFSDLAPLAGYGVDRVRFAHIDADIYEGYRDALQLLTPHLQVGTVIMFDETVPPAEWRYQSIREHGQRALREWEEETGFKLHEIRLEWTVALTVIVDEDYLKRHWRLLTRLRKDTARESLRHLARLALGLELEARVHLD